MSELWYKETCPSCTAVNWICNGGDDSDLDTDSFVCWKCSKVIILFLGEFQDEYSPHIEGTGQFDDFAGSQAFGLEKPQ